MDFNEILINYMYIIIPVMTVLIILLLILLIISMTKQRKFKKRIERFLGSSSERHNIEAMLNSYLHQVKKIGDEYNKLIEDINDINNRMVYCVQKVGLIRYNPFDDVGGDLSFALALLNEDNNGVVINNIYSRESCYTYAKPIKDGKAELIKLSDEEVQALKKAIEG